MNCWAIVVSPLRGLKESKLLTAAGRSQKAKRGKPQTSHNATQNEHDAGDDAEDAPGLG
jgi:hypothetical protein